MSQNESARYYWYAETYLSSLTENLPSEHELAEQLEFSTRFIMRMEKLLRKAANLWQTYETKSDKISFSTWKKRRTVRRRLLVAAIVLGLIAVIVGFAISNRSISLFELKINSRYPDLYDVIYNEKMLAEIHTMDRAAARSQVEGMLPTLIPDGYIEEYRSLGKVSASISIVYKNQAGHEIMLEKRYINDFDGPMVNHENEQYRRIVINGFSGFHAQNRLYGSHMILWTDADFQYIIHASSDVSEEDLLAMARSVSAIQ